MSDTPRVDAYLQRFQTLLHDADEQIREREDTEGIVDPSPDLVLATPVRSALINTGAQHIGDARQAEREGRHEDARAALGAFVRTYLALMKTLPDVCGQEAEGEEASDV